VPDREQHDRFAVCVIPQQYSSVIFVSLRFHSRQQKFGAPLKSVSIPFVFCK
jgi:hypothetical protein